MKKVLFASTALIATAGVASAQGVTLSGSAEMGIFGGTAMETQFHTDIDVKFTLSGETDNGLTFGATIDLDEEGGFAATNGGPESVFLSGNFGTITMGDTDGAFDWAMNEVPAGPGSINDAETSHLGFNGNSGLDGTYDGQIARYDYSFGDFAFAVSAEIDDTGLGDPVIGLGVRYNLNLGGNSAEIAVGYQSVSVGAVDVDVTGLSLDTSLSGINVGLNYSQMSSNAVATDQTHMGIGLGYSMDAISFGVNYGRYDDCGFVAGATCSGFGLSAGYDLGGGASILAGWSTSTLDVGGVSTDTNLWSFGVSMSF